VGFTLCIAPCAGCGKIITFNPVRVPSVRVHGVKEPVCKECIDKANFLRKEKGLQELEYASDAYEPCDEGELC
jgi:hypothetical protein